MQSRCFDGEFQTGEVTMFRRNHHDIHEVDVYTVEEKQHKVNELRLCISEEALSHNGRKYCSDACLSRYLRARNWDVQKAKKMIEHSLAWRASYKPELIRWKDVAIEGETGKVYRADFFDKQGRTVLVLVPANQNTKCSEGQIRHLVYLMENAVMNLPPDQEQMVWLIDFTGWSFTTAVSVKLTYETTNVLQNHYPERLAYAILYNPPRIFQAFWKVVKHFLDPKTYEKVKFVCSNSESIKLMEELFDKTKLHTSFGGEKRVSYDHEMNGKQMEEDDLKAAAFWKTE